MDKHRQESLDPTDWEAMRALGHRMVDDMVAHHKTIRHQPGWQHAPDEIKAAFESGLPLLPEGPESVYEQFLEKVLPYPVGNTHPRFWGWLFGTGSLFGAYAEFLSSAMNTNAGDLDYHSANHVEKQALAWCKEMLGYPAEASGLLTSGCSAANLIGMTVARNAKAPFDLRLKGLGAAPKQMIAYASEEIHSSIQKAVEMLGLGSENLRGIPVDKDFCIDLRALEEAIRQDRLAGRQPFCVIGAAGTANTGAFDDLNGLADICAREELWLHVDGAFGAWTALVPEYAHLVDGMDRADSLAFDLHKWMFMPYEIGCLLVRDRTAHRSAFALTPVYLVSQGEGRGLTGGDLPWLTDLGFQLSREFRALKAWMLIKQHGAEKYGRLIRQNIEPAQYLAGQIEKNPQLELLAPAPLNVVCFRYFAKGLDEELLDALNKEILVRLQEGGIAVPSGTTVNGKYALRVGHTNHRTRYEDFDYLVSEVIKIGDQIFTKRSPEPA